MSIGALAFHIYDVFTDRPFSGNPLALVEGAEGLSAAQMQVIARQFNLSETIFLMAPAGPGEAARVRIFLPRAEIPFAGHPTVGCAIHLAAGADADLVIGTEAGPVPVRVAGGVAEFTAPVLPQTLADLDAAEVAAALGLAAGDIGFGRHRPAVVAAASGFVFVPVADLSALGRARPTGAGFDRLTAEAPCAYLYTPQDGGFRARLFAPAEGVPEDPATGSATACLPARLLAAGDLAEGENRFTLHQGVEMGRPSVLSLGVTVAGGRLARVRVGGRAVKVAEGRILRPEERG